MIQNLEEKLSGLEPVTKEELFELISSHGRKHSKYFVSDNMILETLDPKECYDLSNLDVSQITNMNCMFRGSFFNGDISNWNVSNVKTMEAMFFISKFNGDLSNWDVKNLELASGMFENSLFNNNSLNFWNLESICNMRYMFIQSKFDKDINFLYSNERLNKDLIDCDFIFSDNVSFQNKYNNGNKIPNNTKDFINWLEENRIKIREINTPKEEILDFFSFDSKLITIGVPYDK